TALTPSSATVAQQFTFDITGSNFNSSNAEVLFVGGPNCTTSSPCVVGNGALTTKNATHLVGPATLNDAATFSVYVRNGSSGTWSNAASVTVGLGTPSISGSTPSSATV